MGLFDVYSLLDIEPVKAKNLYLWDAAGVRYTDFYGGHAVISIGHCHPRYVERITEQAGKIGFYSNAVHNPLQVELAERLGHISGYPDYNLFLCNSGAEANENALKLASFVTSRDEVLSIGGAFHGRTSCAVAVTDNPSIQAPLNCCHKVKFTPLNDTAAMEAELSLGKYAAVIVEGIQGVGGIRLPEEGFLKAMRRACDLSGTLMVLDEVQSGCGRTGRYFAHQAADICPDIITMAKGIANGFPVGALLIAPKIEARKGMLGTTFGGSHLACAAALAVIDVMESEKLIRNAAVMGNYLMDELRNIAGVEDVRGRGLMIGVDLPVSQSEFRARLLHDHHMLTGYSGKNTVRVLPPLTVGCKEVKSFIAAFKSTMESF